MRTTLTIDPEVAKRLKSEIRRTGKSLKSIVNDALKAGLGLAAKPGRVPRFKVHPHSFGVRPGVDLDRINQLVDELETEESARRLRS
jgi:hypothetical protein